MAVIQAVLFVLVVAVWSSSQIKTMLRRGEKRETAVYVLLALSAAVIGTLLLFDVRLPSPAAPLRTVFEPVDRWIFGEKMQNGESDGEESG